MSITFNTIEKIMEIKECGDALFSHLPKVEIRKKKRKIVLTPRKRER
jgi:hypothetical protein